MMCAVYSEVDGFVCDLVPFKNCRAVTAVLWLQCRHWRRMSRDAAALLNFICPEWKHRESVFTSKQSFGCKETTKENKTRVSIGFFITFTAIAPVSVHRETCKCFYQMLALCHASTDRLVSLFSSLSVGSRCSSSCLTTTRRTVSVVLSANCKVQIHEIEYQRVYRILSLSQRKQQRIKKIKRRK